MRSFTLFSRPALVAALVCLAICSSDLAGHADAAALGGSARNLARRKEMLLAPRGLRCRSKDGDAAAPAANTPTPATGSAGSEGSDSASTDTTTPQGNASTVAKTDDSSAPTDTSTATTDSSANATDAAATTTDASLPDAGDAKASKAPALKVVGNSLVDGNGNKFVPRGVAIQGTEYQCAHGFGWGEGNGLNQEEVDGILKFGPNTVRVGLNQGCWNGEVIPGFNNSQYIGKGYVQRMTKWVELLLSNGLAVIVDLHWTSGGYVSIGQNIMPDPKSITFWKSVSTTLNKPGVIFDIMNEPYPRSWECWRDGGDACQDEDKNKLNFTAVGMQTLVNTIRTAGAKNPILIECTEGDGGADFSKWPKYAPKDPLKQLVAGIHLYSTLGNCHNATCHQAQMAPVAKEYPIIVGELGQFECDKGWFDAAADFFDKLGIGWITWSYFTPYGGPPAENPQDCNALPNLIKDWDGTPQSWGINVSKRLQSYKNGGASGGSATKPTKRQAYLPQLSYAF